MTKKIAILADYLLFPERIGGMDKFFNKFNIKAEEQGYQLYWFFPGESAHSFYLNFNICFLQRNPSIEHAFLDYSRNNSLDFDVIYLHFLELFSPTLPLMSVFGKKIIYVDHNPRPAIGFGFIKRIKKFLKYMLFEKYVFRIVSVSKELSKQLQNETSSSILNKLVLIENGMDFSSIDKKNVTESGIFKFLVSSHLRKEKGIQDLISALALIHSDFLGKFTLDIYGEGYMKEELMKLTHDYGLEKIVFFKGSFSEMGQVYSKYDYLIHPSYGETFCYSVLESLYGMVPVITTHKHGNVMNMVIEGINGFLFTAGDIQHLSQILSRIISDSIKLNLDNVFMDFSHLELDIVVDKYLRLV